MNPISPTDAMHRADQNRLRNPNERIILSLLQRNGPTPGSDLARQTGLSAQTISVILRKLKSDGLTRQCKPVRGKVGKPSVPIALNPLGALSVGCKLGRRSCDLSVFAVLASLLRSKSGNGALLTGIHRASSSHGKTCRSNVKSHGSRIFLSI